MAGDQVLSRNFSSPHAPTPKPKFSPNQNLCDCCLHSFAVCDGKWKVCVFRLQHASIWGILDVITMTLRDAWANPSSSLVRLTTEYLLGNSHQSLSASNFNILCNVLVLRDLLQAIIQFLNTQDTIQAHRQGGSKRFEGVHSTPPFWLPKHLALHSKCHAGTRCSRFSDPPIEWPQRRSDSLELC